MAESDFASTGALTRETSITVPAGFSAKQYDTILSVVAGKVDTLKNLLILVEGCARASTFEHDVMLSAAQHLSESIGALVDDAAGHAVTGDLYRWHCDPNFYEQAEEAPHG